MIPGRGQGERVKGRAMYLKGVIIYKSNIWPMQVHFVAHAKVCSPIDLVKLWPRYIHPDMQEL